MYPTPSRNSYRPYGSVNRSWFFPFLFRCFLQAELQGLLQFPEGQLVQVAARWCNTLPHFPVPSAQGLLQDLSHRVLLRRQGGQPELIWYPCLL